MSQTRIEYAYDRVLQDMLPKYYEDYVESRQHLATSDKEFARLYADIGEVHSQAFVALSTYMIDYYAELYGIESDNDRARWINLSADKLTWGEASNYTWAQIMALQYKPSGNLRERVLAAMSAKELSSIPDLTGYIETITGYAIELVEFNEDYAMSVYLKDGEGSSLILQDIIAILSPLVPAHIQLFVSMEYLRWVELDSVLFTWDGFDAEDLTWKDLEDKDVWSEWLN